MTDTRDLPGFRIKIGPLTISWASLFSAVLKYPARSRTGERPPLFERPVVQEDEEPYRVGHARILRLWPTNWAISLGWWGDPGISDDKGEIRALSEILGKGTSGVASGMPVTRLFGEITEKELAERTEKWKNEDDGEPEVNNEFKIIDLRTNEAL